MIRLIQITNYTAAVTRATFIAFTTQQAYLILTGYCAIYDCDEIDVRVNGRLVFSGETTQPHSPTLVTYEAQAVWNKLYCNQAA